MSLVALQGPLSVFCARARWGPVHVICLQRGEGGLGLTLRGDSPVLVAGVVPGGCAAVSNCATFSDLCLRSSILMYVFFICHVCQQYSPKVKLYLSYTFFYSLIGYQVTPKTKVLVELCWCKTTQLIMNHECLYMATFLMTAHSFSATFISSTIKQFFQFFFTTCLKRAFLIFHS